MGIRLNVSDADGERLDLRIYGEGPLSEGELAMLEMEVCWRFDLHTDLKQFNALFRTDPLLGPVLERWRGMRVSCAYSLYEFLIVTIVLQNATVRRSAQMLKALLEAYGTLVRYDGRELLAFWRPNDLAWASEEELRQLKVGYRAKTIKELSTRFASGEVDEESLRACDKEAVREQLLKLYGVGPASVGMLLFEVFHRYDAFDVISPWEQKIYSRLLFSAEMVPAAQILEYVKQRWDGWRMLASHYVFEDLFWQRRTRQIPWLETLIRL